MSNNVINNKIPWIEKYRPIKLKDLILSKTMHDKIKNIIKSGILPNMIFTGSPGMGKTSTVLCIAKKLIGSNYKDYILELNASDNRGLEYINSSVLHFCRKKINELNNVKKLIIFDEADNITKKAQNTLANLIEEYRYTTSFVFTCNDSSKIIEGIQSRCFILQYSSINKDQIKKRLKKICKCENIIYDEDGIDAIINISSNDIRQAINNLEATYFGYKEIKKENVNILCYQPQQDIIINIIKNIVELKYYEAIEYIYQLKSDSYCGSDILLNMINIIKDIKIDEDIRINFIKILSDTYIIICDGIDTNIQLYACLGKMFDYIRSTNEKN